MSSPSTLARFTTVLGLAALVACSVVVNEDPVQCSTDADCTSRGPDFVGTVCNGSGFCEVAPPPGAECTKNSECAARGADQVCSSLQKKCVKVTSDECFVAYGDPTADGTVLFGFMSEVSRSETLYFREQQHINAAKLAFTEFFDKTGSRFAGGRGAAIIACSQLFPRKAAAHLANIGAMAVIGPSSEAHQRAIVETLAQGKVPSFSPWINGNPAAVVPGAEGLAWVPSFLRPEVVAPLNALLAEQEVKVKQDLGVPSVRVAVVVNKPVTSTFNSFEEYGSLMDQRLIFNGKSAVENQRDVGCGGCYQRFETSQAEASIVEARAQAIVDFDPHFIIPFADIDWGAQLLPKLEEKYAAKPQGAVRPIYLHTQLQIEEQGYKFLPLSDAAVRKRVTGIRPLRDNSFEVFQNKFREAYRPKSAPDKLGPDPNPGAGRAYETSLLLLFATYAALRDNPNATPLDVANAVKKVTDKASPTKVTLNDLAIGVQRLNANENIDLDGLFTFFDFDETTKSAAATWTTWCASDKGQYVSGRVFTDGSFGPASYCN